MNPVPNPFLHTSTPPMPPTRKSKSVAIEASAPSEKTKTQTRRKNAPTPKTPKNNDVPSQLVEEGPTATPTSPKKRGQKPKHVAAKADNLPTQNMAEALGTKTADKPTGNPHIGSNLKSKKAPVPTRDPLPDQGVRNTHPGVYFGLQPTPRRRPHQVAAARKKKRQELEAQIQAADAVTLGPGIHLFMRFLIVASVLGLLLLPPATQICGKRMFGMTEGIDGVW